MLSFFVGNYVITKYCDESKSAPYVNLLYI